MSIAAAINAAGRAVQRSLRGELVTLFTADGISTEIPDAVVSIDHASVTRGEGPTEVHGMLRLESTHHADAVAAHTATVQGETYSVLHVGALKHGECVVRIGRLDGNHTNIFTLKEQQTVWGE